MAAGVLNGDGDATDERVDGRLTIGCLTGALRTKCVVVGVVSGRAAAAKPVVGAG